MLDFEVVECNHCWHPRIGFEDILATLSSLSVVTVEGWCCKCKTRKCLVGEWLFDGKEFTFQYDERRLDVAHR